MKFFNKWLSEIDASPDGKIEINMQVQFERIMSTNVLMMIFGKDISNEQFEIQLEDVRGSRNFVWKKVGLAEAFFEGKNLL